MTFTRTALRVSRQLSHSPAAAAVQAAPAISTKATLRQALHTVRRSSTPSTSRSPSRVAALIPGLHSSRSHLLQSSGRRHASAVPNSQPTSVDPTEKEAEMELVKGIQCMANNDVEGAGKAFTRSIQIKETPAALYNLALAHYQIGLLPACIAAFERSIELQPSADAHTNVASAYILSTPPNAVKAIEHLQKAIELAPNDGEINFNMGVIFEATGRLEDALREYNRANELGIERAAQCIRNVGGKILEKNRTAGSTEHGKGGN